MSTAAFCLSSATILRCVPLSSIQSTTILIPTFLEVLFTSSLVLILRNSGRRRHLLLTSESWIYCILTILELLTHVLDSAQQNVNAFAALDVTSGVASFLPLFFYCFFLYLYTDTELLPNAVSLPKKIGKVATLLLLILIPAIVGVNEVASFIGVERRLTPSNPPQIVIGFSSPKSWTLNLFFSSLSLAMITLFQAIVFLISAFRLATAILNQRRFEQLGKDATHLIKGVGWLSAGMKLGAVESMIGFAGGGFEIVITRRILRFIARACLCVGIVKGIDEIEDFRAVRRELSMSKNARHFKGNSKGIKNLISNPRISTFRQLSPTANTFYTLPRAHLLSKPTFDYNRDEKVTLPSPSTRTPEGQLRSLQDLGGIATFESLGTVAHSPMERVTIRRESGRAPTLQLRLSMGGFPSPRMISDFPSSRPVSEWIPPSHGSRTRDSDYAVPQDSLDSPWSEKGDNSVYRPEAPSRKQLFSDPEKQPRDSLAQSFADSAVEIVMAPQRTLSQSSALARLYQAPAKPDSSYPFAFRKGSHESLKTVKAPSSLPSRNIAPRKESQAESIRTTGRESPQPGQESDISTSSKIRVTSGFSLQSLPDTLQAVRELASEFPGPPVTYNGRPVVGGLPAKAWVNTPTTAGFFSKSARASIVPPNYGPQSDFPPPESRSGESKHRAKVEDEESAIGGRYEPRPVIMPSTFDQPRPSPDANASRIFVSAAIPPGSTTPPSFPTTPNHRTVKPKPSVISTTERSIRSIDPFDDSQSPSTPVQEIMNRPTLLRPQPRAEAGSTLHIRPNHDVSVPATPDSATPSSRYDMAPRVNTNPFKDSAAGETGKVQNDRWKYDSSTLPPAPEKAFAPGEGLPSTPTRFSSVNAEMRVSTFAYPAGADSRRPPSKVVWVPQGEDAVTVDRNDDIDDDDHDLSRSQERWEERRRQRSMDAAAHTLSNSIPWLKNPDIEEEERQIQKAISTTAASLTTSSERYPRISRIMTVGSVAMRPTPQHTTGHMRRSLRAEPIMIPPPLESYAGMEVVDESTGKDSS